MRTIAAGFPLLIPYQVRKQAVFMKNRSVDSDPSAVTKGLLTGPEEPAPELLPPILILYLFVIFQIITNDQTRTFSSPLTSTDLLLRASSYNAKLMTIRTLNNDVSLLLLYKPLDLEISPECFVLPQLVGDISQMLDSEVFRRANENDVIFVSEANVRQDIIVGEACRLRMVPRGGGGTGWIRRAITTPAFSMEWRCRLRLIVAGGEIDA